MLWSSRFVAQPSAEEVVALLRSVHEITAETQGEPINKSIPSSSIVFAGPDDSNLGGCFSAANLTWSVSAKCPEPTHDISILFGRYRGFFLFRRASAKVCFSHKTSRSWPLRANKINSAIRPAVPGAGQEAEIDLSPQVTDGPCPSHTARRHSDRRR